MVIACGDVVWVDFGSPRGSEPEKVRPVVVVQEDWLLAATIATVQVVPLTSNRALEAFPGNVLIPAEACGLEKDFVAVVSQVGPIGRELLDRYPAGHVPAYLLAEIDTGIRLVLGL